MRVAVVGGGIFGSTAAIHLAREGHEVELFEAKSNVMRGASGSSYYRLHRGYHYPRSPITGKESRMAEAAFRYEFGQAVIDGGWQSYAIANEGSHVTGEQFADFMHASKLFFRRDVSIPGCDWVFRVKEPRINEHVLTSLILDKLAHIKVHTNTPATPDLRKRFDQIVVAAYAQENKVLEVLGIKGRDYKFQLVEKPIVRMPAEFANKSIVVLDGPFCCLDPYGATDCHVLGHVTQTIHSEKVGLHPDPWVGARPRVNQVIEAMSEFIPGVTNATYVRSMFTTRAVLPYLESTDERPTLVDRLDGQVQRIFSGKIGTAVVAAQSVCSNLHKMDGRLQAVG